MTKVEISRVEYEQLVALRERSQLLDTSSGIGLWEALLHNGDAFHRHSEWTWSGEFRRLLGFGNEQDFPNEVEAWSTRLHPDDAQSVFTTFAESLQNRTGGCSYDFHYRIKMRDGQYRWFRARGGCVHLQDGRIRACGSMSDVHEAMTARLEMEKEAEEHIEALSVLHTAFSQLADGQLGLKITTDVPPKMAGLKTDFNRATSSLAQLMHKVLEAVENISSVSRSMNGASSELHERSLEQSTSLEETSAAVVEIAGTVKHTADSSRASATEAQLNKRRSDECGDIVKQAISAMDSIEDSSGKITGIISTIENIAFQTNMLALNAAVEAARAGDAGRGFAVVASEVRDLAQRSTDAAREITNLILSSKEHVSKGVKLVNQTGSALSEIALGVDHISQAVSGISDAAAEQSSALNEIERNVSTIDQLNQRNTEMSEQNGKVVDSLTTSVAALSNLLSRFTIPRTEQSRHRRLAS